MIQKIHQESHKKHLPAGQGDSPGDGNGGGSDSGHKVTLTVVNGNNQNTSGVTVVLTDKSDTTNKKTGESDNDGKVEIDNVKAGTYAVTVDEEHSDGYHLSDTVADITVADADVTVSDPVRVSKT